MKKLILLFSMLFLLTGCITGPSVCDNRGDAKSYLCAMADTSGVRLESVGNILIVANSVAIGQGAYSKEEAVVVLKSILIVVERGPSYSHIRKTVIKETDKYPGLFIIADSYISNMNQPQVISKFDKDILTAWINRQITSLGGE